MIEKTVLNIILAVSLSRDACSVIKLSQCVNETFVLFFQFCHIAFFLLLQEREVEIWTDGRCVKAIPCMNTLNYHNSMNRTIITLTCGYLPYTVHIVAHIYGDITRKENSTGSVD